MDWETIEPFVRYIALPAIGYLGHRLQTQEKRLGKLADKLNALQLEMAEKIGREEAVRLIERSTRDMSGKIDLMYLHMLEESKK